MIALIPLPDCPADPIRCYACGRPGLGNFYQWAAGSRIGVVRFCDPGCRSVFVRFVQLDNEVAYEIISAYTLFPLTDVVNQYQFQKWSAKHGQNKSKV